MSAQWKVSVAQLGRWEGIPGPELFWMSDFKRTYTIALLTVIATSPDGDIAVINTGPDPKELERLNSLWAVGVGPECKLVIEETLESLFTARGLDVDRVKWVFATPFQAYTVGNLHLFPNARICLSRTGWEFFFGNSYPDHPHDYPPNVFPPDVLAYLLYTAADRLLLLNDDHEVAPGLTTRFTGAHHRASIGVSFDTARGDVVVSDSAFVRENLEPGRILGIIENMYEALDAYKWFRSASVFVPLYDPRIVHDYPSGVIA